jgi:aryl-alcohol dehydrogenase-like predicted oxidoreductase
VRLDQDQADRVVHAAIDAGITMFDCADIYGAGKAEIVLGQALKGRRQDVVVASKFGIIRECSTRGGSRSHVIRSCEISLKKLQTDYIDLYYYHKPDGHTPIDETLAAMDDLVRQGKVRYIASSNMTGWQMVDADHVARNANNARFVGAQIEWSLLNRDIEREIVPAARHLGMGIIPYFPLASGLLTGKYKRDEALPADSRIAKWPGFDGILTPENFDKVEKFTRFAEERGHSLLELAISWVASHDVVASVLCGATKPEQVRSNVEAAGWRLTAEDLAALDAL